MATSARHPSHGPYEEAPGASRFALARPWQRGPGWAARAGSPERAATGCPCRGRGERRARRRGAARVG